MNIHAPGRWGEAWGEMGFFRIERGSNAMCMELQCDWATPQTWTEHNYPCDENGANCAPHSETYVDPSMTGIPAAVAVTQHVLN